MKCSTCTKNLILYVEGAVPEQVRAEIENHLAGCRTCAAFSDYLRMSLNQIEEEKRIEPQPYLFTRIKARMAALESAPRRKTGYAVLQPVFMSFLLALAIYSGIALGNYFGSPGDMDYFSNSLAPIVYEMHSETLESFLMD